MKKRNVAALVTDGVVRDRSGVLMSGLPVWSAGVAAPASVNGLTFVGWQQPIGCGGCAVFPADVIVADDDGVVVVPRKDAAAVAKAGEEREKKEAGNRARLQKGELGLDIYGMRKQLEEKGLKYVDGPVDY
jgi:regulator of RNase E activity RraA